MPVVRSKFSVCGRTPPFYSFGTARPVEGTDPLLSSFKGSSYALLIGICTELGIGFTSINPCRWGTEDEPTKNAVCLFVTVSSKSSMEPDKAILTSKFVDILQLEDKRWHIFKSGEVSALKFACFAKIEQMEAGRYMCTGKSMRSDHTPIGTMIGCLRCREEAEQQRGEAERRGTLGLVIDVTIRDGDLKCRTCGEIRRYVLTCHHIATAQRKALAPSKQGNSGKIVNEFLTSNEFD